MRYPNLLSSVILRDELHSQTKEINGLCVPKRPMSFLELMLKQHRYITV